MAGEKEAIQSVQVFGRKKTATAVAYCKRGKRDDDDDAAGGAQDHRRQEVCWIFDNVEIFQLNCDLFTAHDSNIGLKKREPDADKVIEGGSVGDVKDKKQQQQQQ